LFSHFIPCGVWEAIYILDCLTKNKSDIQLDTVHGDTQVQSAPVYGLALLLGIKLMPRIR
jgi:TnpA family transposase